MTSRRIIACIVVKNGWAVQSFAFGRYLPVGRPRIVAAYLDRWGIDEIVLLDIDATREGRGPAMDVVTSVAHAISCPLTVGGGIGSLECARRVVEQGADKIAINSAAALGPEIVHRIADSLGSQCVVASIDACRRPDGSYGVFARGRTDLAVDVYRHAARLADLGAGEILINSTERDGSGTGYDLTLIEGVARSVTIPVIALGGASRSEHFAAVLRIDGIAAAAANIFNHFEHSVTLIKENLIQHGFPVHLRAEFGYEGASPRPLRHDREVPRWV